MISLRVAVASIALSQSLPIAIASTECTRLAEVMGLQIIRASGDSDFRKVQSYTFCLSEYSNASRSDQLQIEAGFKALTGSGHRDVREITEKQSEVCKGSFGLEYLRTNSAAESIQASAAGAQVVTSCLQQNSARITDIKYDYPAVSFSVRNETNQALSVRGVVATPERLIKKCTVANATKSLLFRDELRPGDAVSVLCELNATDSSSDGAEGQPTFGGGFLQLDIPGSSVGSLPVPRGLSSSLQQRLDTQKKQVQTQLADANKSISELREQLRQSQEANTNLRRTAEAAERSAISRLHVFTNCIPPIPGLPQSARFHYLEQRQPGSCTPTWGPLAREFAARTCGGPDRFDMDNLQNVGGGAGGLTVGAFICRAQPLP